jgi:hypothetical protein
MKSKGWKTLFLLLGAGFLAVGILIGGYAFVPSVPPKVSLKFERFSRQGTNTVAQIRFTNEGKKPVWWNGGYSVFTLDDPKVGPLLTMSCWTSGIPSSLQPASSFIISVDVPPDYGKWRLSTDFNYYNHYPAKVVLRERCLMGDWRPDPNSRFEQARFNVALWAARHLPEPKAQTGEVSTPFLTNQPPTGPIAPVLRP